MTWMVNGGYARPFGGEKRSPFKGLCLNKAGNLKPRGNVGCPDAERESETEEGRPTMHTSGEESGMHAEMARFQKSMSKMADRFFEKQQAVMQACLRRQDKGSD